MFGSGLVSTRDGAVAFSANSIPLLDQLVAIQSDVCFAARLVRGKDLEVENLRLVSARATACFKSTQHTSDSSSEAPRQPWHGTLNVA